MNRAIAIVFVCLAACFVNCGGATPEPETAANVDPSSTNNEAGEDDATSEELSSTDPQTTEEVIESSEPLD